MALALFQSADRVGGVVARGDGAAGGFDEVDRFGGRGGDDDVDWGCEGRALAREELDTVAYVAVYQAGAVEGLDCDGPGGVEAGFVDALLDCVEVYFRVGLGVA